MALKTTVKISNVTNLSDARYCAGMGVDLLGFSMDEDSEQYIEPKKFEEIRSWVAGVQIIGETAVTDPETLDALLETYQPDGVQVEEASLVPYVASFNLPVILKLDLALLTLDQMEALLTANYAGLTYILLESKAAFNLDEELKTALQRLADRYSLLLGTGVTAENIHDLLTDMPIKGIALTGGQEDRPGYREFGELMDILEILEED
ncbi:beta/alpha barrel domain-containing protein [Tellurirhabdus bombi]|uniref:N-(5'-phosphoribosyl)anthranilate isomerase n=1 Tax=Tellurirhabdus bombi TaxID=2907205 RepID=UPI001F25FB38|nr:N-(5'-phosphoribosyl)anthranilate isomerase [Tellurirhabdus bombi]